jgi:hypothetical protein
MKDVCYASLFDKKDLPYIYRLAEEIRTTHNQDLVNEFNNKLENKWNDHNHYLQIGNRDIEIQQVAKADDLVVTVGINQCIDQILGASTTRWQYMARGTGTTTPAAANTTLVTEVASRVDMSTSGWREYAGSSLRFAGIHGESIATITVNECGVFTAFTSGTMLNRNVFSNFPLTHTINIDGIVLSAVVEFVPVM